MDEEAVLRLYLSEQRLLLAGLLHHAELEVEAISNMIGELDLRLAGLASDVT